MDYDEIVSCLTRQSFVFPVLRVIFQTTTRLSLKSIGVLRTCRASVDKRKPRVWPIYVQYVGPRDRCKAPGKRYHRPIIDIFS